MKVGRLLVLIVLSALALQLWFLARVGLMRFVDPASTTFERSEIRRLLGERGTAFYWRQRWTPNAGIAPNLKRAVVASEDAGFVEHAGVEWDAIERAWEKNQRAEARAAVRATAPKMIGGSTITQQLAKNLFLDGERSLPRKAQEFAIAMMLETCLDKRRILEIYLNHVEWGEGVFGADAAARRYFGIGPEALSPLQAARLAVLLPAPKRFEKRPASGYIAARAGTIASRMPAVTLP